MSRAVHVARIVHMRNAYKILGGKRKWRMPFGIENWARDSKFIGLRVKIQWQALANTF